MRLAVLVFLVALMLAPSAQAGGLGEWITGGPKDTDPNPAKTLLAPFADIREEEAQDTADILSRLPENQIPMDQPHRSKEQIKAWVVTNVSEAMSFLTGNIDDSLALTKGDFSAEGREQYLDFMRRTALLQPLTGGDMTMRSVVREEPFLLNEGEVSGHYRWLYDVPLMVTYLPLAADGYLKTQAQNKMVVVKVQVGRSLATEDPEGMMIESWSGKIAE